MRLSRFLSGLLLVWLGVVQAQAATGLSSVIFTNLNKASFLVDLSAAPTNMVKLAPSQTFTNLTITNGGTITINGTNVAVVNPTDLIVPYRVSSNAFGDSSLQRIDLLSVQGTNFTTKARLATDGAFVTGLAASYAVAAGTNTITLTNAAFVAISSLSAAATIQLTTGSAVGARALLLNADTNFSFTLTNAPLVDDGAKSVFVAGGSWIPSQLGESLQLVYTGSGWFEEGRMNPNTNNIVGTSHWTNAAGLLRPIDLFIPVAADSINATNQLSTDGAFLTRTYQTSVLVSGTNVLNPFNTAYFVLASTDTNVVVQLNTGNGSGQHIWLLNYWTNATFTLPSGPLADDTNAVVVVRGGAWTPTEPGESLELLATPNGWVEIGRSNPLGPAPAVGFNYWTNIADVLQPIAHAAGTNQFTIDPVTGWTGTGTNYFGDDGKFHGTAINTNGGNLNGSLSAPFLPYATGTDTLADSPAYRIDGNTVGTTNLVAVTITNTGTFTSGGAVYTFPAIVGGGDFLMAGAVTVPTGFDPYYHVALEWRGASTNAITNITVQQITVQSNITVNGTNIASVNPTDGYLPVRASADSFQDSPVHIVSPSLQDVIFDGKIFFGPGLTNVIYRDGNDLVYTNGAADVKLSVIDGSGYGISLEAQGAAGVLSTVNASTLTLRAGAQQVTMVANAFSPTVDITESLGTSTTRWLDANFAGTAYVWGYGGAVATNYSRLAVSHSGTNGLPILFDSQSSGIAGPAGGFNFRSNTTIIASIAANSGYTGGGTKFLSDDGTYKAGTGGVADSLWTNLSSRVQLIVTNANVSLNLSADDGAGSGEIRMATVGTNRWQIDSSGNFLPLDLYTLGSSIHPIGTIYGSGLLGIELGNTSVKAGNGSPESVVLADVGSLWMQTNGAPGYTLWTKISGTGTTGWATVQYPWYAVDSTNAAIDGKLIFGPGSTNTIYRRTNDFTFTIGNTNALTLSREALTTLVSAEDELILTPGSGFEIRFRTEGSDRWQIDQTGDFMPLNSSTHSIGYQSSSETISPVKRVFADTFILTGGFTPSSSSQTNFAGAITWDTSFLYIWTATNVNKRVALSTW